MSYGKRKHRNPRLPNQPKRPWWNTKFYRKGARYFTSALGGIAGGALGYINNNIPGLLAGGTYGAQVGYKKKNQLFNRKLHMRRQTGSNRGPVLISNPRVIPNTGSNHVYGPDKKKYVNSVRPRYIQPKHKRAHRKFFY